MGGDIPPEVFQAYLDQQRAAEARQARMTARQVLAEMVRQEVTERTLTSRRRNALIRYATKLGLDAYEARLLVRAAEFGFGDKSDEHEQVAREYLADLQEPTRSPASLWVIVSAVLINCLGLLWLLRRGG